MSNISPTDADLLKRIGVTSDELLDNGTLVNQLRTAGRSDEANALERLRLQVGGSAAKANAAEQEINAADRFHQRTGMNNISAGYGQRTRK